MLVGREKETEQLLRALDKPEAQLIAVYGRRCIGKAYLIRETFGKLYLSACGRLRVRGTPSILR